MKRKNFVESLSVVEDGARACKHSSCSELAVVRALVGNIVDLLNRPVYDADARLHAARSGHPNCLLIAF